MERTVSFYTSNRGKVAEARALLAPAGFRVKWMKGELPEPQANSLEDVVRVKLGATRKGDRYAMVEDSGLFIGALGGFPGVYSAYVLRTIGLEGILKLVEGRGRTAEFRAVVGFRSGRSVKLFEGVMRGTLGLEMRGDHGFGYDPIFIPSGQPLTSAEMDLEAKNRISHRGIAMRKLSSWLTRPRKGAGSA